MFEYILRLICHAVRRRFLEQRIVFVLVRPSTFCILCFLPHKICCFEQITCIIAITKFTSSMCCTTLLQWQSTSMRAEFAITRVPLSIYMTWCLCFTLPPYDQFHAKPCAPCLCCRWRTGWDWAMDSHRSGNVVLHVDCRWRRRSALFCVVLCGKEYLEVHTSPRGNYGKYVMFCFCIICIYRKPYNHFSRSIMRKYRILNAAYCFLQKDWLQTLQKCVNLLPATKFLLWLLNWIYRPNKDC